MKKPQRLKPEERREQILAEALRQATVGHYTTITRDSVMDALGISGPALFYYFKSVGELKRAIVQRAVDEENLAVVGQAAIANDVNVGGHLIPPVLRARAFNYLIEGLSE